MQHSFKQSYIAACSSFICMALLAAFTLTVSPSYAFGQNDPSSVEVDFSVLEQLGQFDDLSDQVELPAAQPDGGYGYNTKEFVLSPVPKPARKPYRSYVQPPKRKVPVVPVAKVQKYAPSPLPAKKPYWQNQQRAYKAAEIIRRDIPKAPKPEQRSLLDRLYDSEIKNPEAAQASPLLQKQKIARKSLKSADPLSPYKALMVENEDQADLDSFMRVRESNIPDILSPKEQDLIQQVLNAPPMRAPADTGPLEPPKEKKRVWKPIKTEPTPSQIQARRHVTVHKVLPATSVSDVPKPVTSEELTAPMGYQAKTTLSISDSPEEKELVEPSISSVVSGAPYPYKKPAQPFKRYSEQLADFSKSQAQKGLSTIVPLPPKTPSKKIHMAVYQQKKRKRGVPIMPAVPAPHVDSQPLASELLKTTSMPSKAMRDISDYDTLPPVQSSSVNAIDLTESVTPQKPATAPEKIMQASLPQPEKMNSKPMVPRLPPKASNEEKDFVTLPFAPETADLTEEISRSLYRDVVPMMMKNQHWRIQIQAFASAQGRGGISSARRMSLSRALSIRTFLLDQGIEPHRMDVRALGIKTDRTPLDRVDLVFFDPSEK